MGLTYVDPQAYYDAARKLTDIGTSIDAATTALVKALWETGSMAGTSEAATKWAISYDTCASHAVTGARKLAQTLPYFASLVALAGYNHDLANYRADIKPTRVAPSKPAVLSAPGPLDWAAAPASGGPGDGIRAVHALMDRIHVNVPDGDTDKLAAASKAWLDFMYARGVDQAGRDISSVLGALEQHNTALEPGLTDQLTTLSVAADKIWAAAQQLSKDCANHKEPLDDLRARIKHAIDDLEIATGITLAATVFADVVTAGIGVVLDAAAVAAEAKCFDQAAETITAAVESVGVDQTLIAAAQEADTLGNTVRDIDEVASLTPEEIEEEASGVQFNDRRRPRLGSDGKYHIRPGLDNDVKIEDPNDMSRTITDIDKVDNGVLWEEKSAINGGQDQDRWIDKQVSTKLDRYVDARQYIAGADNAPIGIEFTTPGADPAFRAAVEQAVADARTRHPGVTFLVKWAE